MNITLTLVGSLIALISVMVTLWSSVGLASLNSALFSKILGSKKQFNKADLLKYINEVDPDFGQQLINEFHSNNALIASSEAAISAKNKDEVMSAVTITNQYADKGTEGFVSNEEGKSEVLGIDPDMIENITADSYLNNVQTLEDMTVNFIGSTSESSGISSDINDYPDTKEGILLRPDGTIDYGWWQSIGGAQLWKYGLGYYYSFGDGWGILTSLRGYRINGVTYGDISTIVGIDEPSLQNPIENGNRKSINTKLREELRL